MKFFAVLCSIFVAVQAVDKEFIAKFVEKVHAIGEECIPETHASKDDINNLLNHKLPESQEGKCLLFCFHKRFNLQNDDGSVNKEGAMEALEPLKEHDAEIYDKVVKVFKTCGEIEADSDPCLFAASLAECTIKEGKAMGLDEVFLIE